MKKLTINFGMGSHTEIECDSVHFFSGNLYVKVGNREEIFTGFTSFIVK